MANRSSQVPRSLKFHENSIRNFVQSSSFLNSTSALPNNNYIQQKAQPVHNQTHTNFHNVKKSYDFYNKNNLLLKACNQQDIQYVYKNPLVYQQNIVIPYQYQYKGEGRSNTPSAQNNEKSKAKTAGNFYKPQQVDANKQKMSKQAELNQFLFNYRKNQEDKKNKKIKFLAQMEAKLTNLQKQANKLESQKQIQYQQINQILKIHTDAADNARKAEMVGKLNTVLHMAQPDTHQIPVPKKITEEMELMQVNLAIQQNHEANDALLQQIQRVSRSKSKQKNKNQHSQLNLQRTSFKKIDDNKQPSSLSKTLKKPMQAPPKPTSGSKKLKSTHR